MPQRLRICAAVAVLAALLVGCSSSESSGDSSSSAPLPDAATLLKQSTQTTKDLKSAHLELKVEGKIKGLPVKTLSGDLTNTPAVAAKGKTQLTLGGGDLVDVEFVVIDTNLYASVDPGVWSNFGAAANIYDVSVILNPDAGLANVLANFTEPKADGRETINGVQTVKVTGQVSADAVNKIAPDIASGDGVPGTAWIKEDGNHELVQAKLEPTPGSSVQMTLSKWNEPVEVTKPPGV